MAGGLGETNIAHEIAHPIHVRVATSDDGREEAIEIESESRAGDAGEVFALKGF